MKKVKEMHASKQHKTSADAAESKCAAGCQCPACKAKAAAKAKAEK